MITPDKTPTPRTDAEEYCKGNAEYGPQFDFVPSDLARKLERELAAAQAENRRLREALESFSEAVVREFGEPTPELFAYHSTANDEFANRNIAILWENLNDARAALAPATEREG